MSSSRFAIPEHSLVLVTGANGFVGSHTAREFLKRGFRVRGTVRDLSRAAWLVNDVLKSYADSGDFELVEVKDFTAEHAFDEAVKGVSAIAHIATVASFDPNPHNVVPQTVAGVISLLKAALKQPEVKEFVFTSSIVAAALPAPGVVAHVDENSWNEAAHELAWAPPPYTADRGMIVYMASKVEAEKALWEFGKRERPHFNLNVVSPGAILGEPLHATHIDGPAAWAKWLYEGELERLTSVASLYVVDVKDIALLHVAAALDPDVKGARIQAWGDLTDWNHILDIMRKQYPALKFMDDISECDITKMGLTTDAKQAFALIEKWQPGQHGWRALKDIIEENISKIVEWDPKN